MGPCTQVHGSSHALNQVSMHVFMMLMMAYDARNPESFLGPKVELGSVPLGLNLTQPLTAPKNFRDVWRTQVYGARN